MTALLDDPAYLAGIAASNAVVDAIPGTVDEPCRYCGAMQRPWDVNKHWCPEAQAVARTIPLGGIRTP